MPQPARPATAVAGKPSALMTGVSPRNEDFRSAPLMFVRINRRHRVWSASHVPHPELIAAVRSVAIQFNGRQPRPRCDLSRTEPAAEARPELEPQRDGRETRQLSCQPVTRPPRPQSHR